MMRRWMLGAATLAVTACAKGGAESSTPAATELVKVGDRMVSPSLSDDGRRVAYWVPADTGGVSTLYLANADFTAPEATPITSADGGRPVWSPDGTHVAFDEFNETVIADLSTRTSRRVKGAPGGLIAPISWSRASDRLALVQTNAGIINTVELDLATGALRPLLPAERRFHVGYFLPDGRGLLVSVVAQGKQMIGIVDSAGAPMRLLTTEGFEGFGEPRFTISPDGTELVYVSSRTGRGDLWVVPLAGGAARQLTQDVRDDSDARWTPDGTAIVFRSTRGAQTDLWMVPRAGGEARRLTDSPEVEALLGWRNGRDELVFSTGDRRSSLVVRSLRDGTERELLADSLRVKSSWTLSPDRTLAAATLERGGGVDDLVVVDVASGVVRTRIGVGGAVRDDLAWSPDGHTLAMVSNRGGSQDIWTIGVGDTTFTRVTDWPGAESTPVFNADGRFLYFTANRDSKFYDLWRAPIGGGQPTRVTTAGNVIALAGRMNTGIDGRTPADLIAAVIRESDGALTSVRLSDDGRMSPVWTGGGAGGARGDSRGDSLVVIVNDGAVATTRLVPYGGGEGRVILGNGFLPLEISVDARQLLFRITAGANTDLGLLDLATGERRMLTQTPQASEPGAYFSANPDQIVLRRERLSTRYLAVPLPKSR